MAYDGATGNVVLFGGLDVSGNTLNDTWIWNGIEWTQQFPPVSPPGRDFDTQSMTYDAHTGTVLLFGGTGDNDSGVVGDTWEWNGKLKTWTQEFPATSPSPRRTTLAYDGVRESVVVWWRQWSR